MSNNFELHQINNPSRFNQTNCIVCGSHKQKKLLEKTLNDQSNNRINLCKCLACQTVYLHQWPAEFVPELYNYYGNRLDQEKTTLYDPINNSRCEALLNSLKPLVKGRKMLDVGCGQGQLVDVALQCGWDVSGIELSDSAVAVCKKFGLPVEQMDLFDPNLKLNSFDLITLSEVIEHVSYPDKFIARIADLLKPEGLLYLTTPNFDSLDRRILGADWKVIHREHLVYFTPKTLKQLIKNNTKLKIIYLKTKDLSTESMRRLMPKNILPKKLKNIIENQSCHNSVITVDKDQLLRHHIESSLSLKIVKFSVNKILNLFGTGATMITLCRKTS